MNPTPTLEDALAALNKRHEDRPQSSYDRLLAMLRLAINQRNEALNWAVDDMGRVIHELAPERDAELIKIARGET